ncbi:hypothetical protein M5E86_15805 [Blautia wexlerae]|nr:hypothetical protein M5E86_15805 [Blautia wexlerae]
MHMVPFVFFWTKKKVKLASLKPDTDTTKITLKVKEKKRVPLYRHQLFVKRKVFF